MLNSVVDFFIVGVLGAKPLGEGVAEDMANAIRDCRGPLQGPRNDNVVLGNSKKTCFFIRTFIYLSLDRVAGYPPEIKKKAQIDDRVVERPPETKKKAH